MIADNYFELRARLGAALFSLSKVAEESGVQADRAVLLRQLVGSLRDPFLFVVAGEVNAGKSTFLNALFGEAFCEADVLPTTEKIVYFKHAAEPRDVVIDDSFVELYRNIPFLRDFHIVDTPGTNSIAEGHQEITERFIPMADLVIFVFSVMNPWGASTWDFIEQIYDGWLKNCLFVVQQSDLRSPAEVHAIVEHMRVTARKRLRRDFPVFPVSGKKAFVAKTSAHEQSDILKDSGFPALEEYISRMVISTSAMRQKFQNAIHTARVIMTEVETELRDTRALLDNDRRVLEALDAEITSQHRQTSERLDARKQAILSDFRAAAERAWNRLGKGRGFFATLFGRRGLVARVEGQLAEETAEAGRQASGDAIREIEDALPPLWQRLEAGIQREFRLDLPINDESGNFRWLRAREGFADDLADQCRGALLDSEAVEQMTRNTEARRTGARIFAVLFLLGALAGAGGVFLKLSVVTLAGAAVAGVGLLGLIVALARKGKAFRSLFDERITRSGEALERAVSASFTTRMGKYYREFLGVFDTVRTFCETQRAEYQPLLDDMRNLGGTFAAIESEIEDHARRAEAEVARPS